MICNIAVLQAVAQLKYMLIYRLQLVWNLVNISCKITVNYFHNVEYNPPKHMVNSLPHLKYIIEYSKMNYTV
jgi:hypothetical protein